MDEAASRCHLITLLHRAYSGELAAGLAYRGHAASLRDPGERAHVRRIEGEEWVHRAEVGRLLAALGAEPQRLREAWMTIVGCAVAASCHLGGWFVPMYFAGRLEHSNIDEYAVAADYARALALPGLEGCLAQMAGVEQEHEAYFRAVIRGHRWLPLFKRLFGWG